MRFISDINLYYIIDALVIDMKLSQILLLLFIYVVDICHPIIDFIFK